MKCFLTITLSLCLFLINGCSCSSTTFTEKNRIEQNSKSKDSKTIIIEVSEKSHPLVEAARKQIGVITKYDTSYYTGGYPPEGSGACTDVIESALKQNDYDLKKQIDQDMSTNSEKYPNSPDPNINYRRVTNVKVFLDRYAEKISTCVEDTCFTDNTWQPGDIVTFDQIPGSLWHIAIVSNRVKKIRNTESKEYIKIPYLIHNYGNGTVEDDMLLRWPAPITGHYRVNNLLNIDGN